MTISRRNCLFCRIAEGSEPGYLVLDEESCLAFLDTRPLFPGHCLLIPRLHVGTLGDLPDPLVEPLFTTVRLLARAVEESMRCQGTFVAINNKVSQSVPHLHVHVVPRNKGDGLRGFFWPRSGYRDGEHLSQVRNLIRDRLLALRDGGGKGVED